MPHILRKTAFFLGSAYVLFLISLPSVAAQAPNNKSESSVPAQAKKEDPAQSPDANLPPVHLEEILKTAYDNNASIKDQIESLNIAQSQLSLSHSILFPKLSTAATLSKTDTTDSGSTLSFRADQNLFDGGIEYSDIAYRKRLLEVEKARLEDTRDLVRHDVLLAILNGSLAQEQLRIYQSSLETQKNRVVELTRRFRLGQTREPDLIQANLDMEKAERLSVDARGATDAARRDLMIAIKQDLAPGYTFPDLDALVNEIRKNSAIGPRAGYETRVIELEIEAADFNRKSKWREVLPTLGAFAAASPHHGLSGNDYQIGLQANWVFFEGFKTVHEVDVAKAEKTQFEIRLDNLRFTQAKTLAQLKIDRENAVSKLRDLRKNVSEAERGLKLQQIDYRLKMVTALEIQTSIQAVLNLNLEQADLRYRAGQLRIEAIKTGGSL